MPLNDIPTARYVAKLDVHVIAKPQSCSLLFHQQTIIRVQEEPIVERRQASPPDPTVVESTTEEPNGQPGGATLQFTRTSQRSVSVRADGSDVTREESGEDTATNTVL